MKKGKSMISLLLILCMLVTMLPANSMVTQAETLASEMDTDLTIDFDFAKKNNIKSAQDTLQKTVENNRKTTFLGSDIMDMNYENYPYAWIGVGKNEFGADKGKLREYLESTNDKYKYIYLTTDQYHEPGYTDFDTIDITTDKVLDLNGYKIELFDKRNKVDTHERKWYESDKYWQSTVAGDHKSIMFSISNGATLTIIDSSAQYDINGKGTGAILSYGYMVNPYKYDINYYTTRDLFWVGNGNLVIYGGTYQAGRSKEQYKSNFTWEKLKTCIGTATQLAVDVTEYVYGIKSATAALDDVKTEWERREKAESQDADNGGTTPTDSTNKKTGEGAKEEKKVTTPKADAEKNPAAGRNQTIAEKQDAKNEEAKKKDPNAKPENNVGNNTNTGSGSEGSGNDSDENNNNNSTAKKYDKNTQLVEAEKKIATSIVNKTAIDSMVENGMDFVDQLCGMFGTDAKSGVNQSIHGTVVHVGNGGTFVSYGGTYKGFGSSPNVRNGVVEVTKGSTMNPLGNDKWQGGQAFIYDGTFEGHSGANIFNMVKANSDQTVCQYERDANSTKVISRNVKLDETETQGLEVLLFENLEEIAKGAEPIPVDTRNVVVRGGVFRNYYEFMNVGIRGNTADEDMHFMKYPGNPGSVNLGIESYGEDLIRDGRIQIEDKYGDGALVLMDERRDEEKSGGVYHYRLFCSENELRYNRYLEVYPNKSLTNSTHSFKLEMAKYGDSNQKDLTKVFTSDEENIRGAVFNNVEKYFSYPIDDPTMSDKYYVMPDLTDTNVYGEDLEQSEVWYYNAPVDSKGKIIPDFSYATIGCTGTDAATGASINSHYHASKSMEAVVKALEKTTDGTLKGTLSEYKNYRTNVKWFRYRVYRVDPLTRENISESDVYGEDKPLAEVVYGTDNRSLKCKLELADVARQIAENNKNWKGFQSGELYRIVFNVDEYMNFNYLGNGKFTNSLDTASAESTILFRCYSVREDLVDKDGLTLEDDFTPIQWVDEPEPGKYATVEIVNGKAGQVDYAGDKIFDIYYQWWEVDENGKNKTLLAGTTNVFDGTGKYAGQDKSNHTYTHWKVGSDGETYVNTVDPKDPKAASYGENGLPTDKFQWSDKLLHAYTFEMTARNDLKKKTNLNLCLENNRIFETGIDSCYIPDYLAGRNIRVKVIAVNCTYPLNYDQKQVFYSRIIKVPGEVTPIDSAVSVKVDNPSGMYATYENPATIGIDQVTGLLQGEYIKSVKYHAQTGSGRKVEVKDFKAFTAEEIPTVKFPQDFYDSDYKADWISAGNRKMTAVFETNYNRKFETGVKVLEYEIEATALEASKAKHRFNLNEILSGEVKNGKVSAFETVPYNASVGFSYSDFTATNPEVAAIDSFGKLVFGGKAGQSVITVKNLDGTEVSTTVNIIDYYDKIEILGIDAPVVGQPLDTTAEVPENARYTVKEVFWTDGKNREKLPSDTVAEYFHSYRVHVVVEDKVNCELEKFFSTYAITWNNANGTTDTDTGPANGENFAYSYDEVTYDYCGPYTVSHQFPADAGALDGKTEIDKIFIEFPTEVWEGENVSTWKDKIKVYSYDGVELRTEITQSFSKDYTNILAAYGYSSTNEAYINTFVKGVQTGPYFKIYIPEGVNLTFKDTQIYVNGALGVGKKEITYDDTIYFSAYNTLNIQEGTVLEELPYYEVKDFEFVVGETVYINDLLECDNNSVKLVFKGMTDTSWSETVNPEEHIEYKEDPEKGVALTAIKELMDSDNGGEKTIGIQIDIMIDSNGDGIHEMRGTHNTEHRVYPTRADVPAKEAEKEYRLVVLNPEGKTIYEGNHMTGERVAIPEIKNTFIQSVQGDKGGILYELLYDKSQIMLYNSATETGETITISTSSALDLEVSVSDTAVFAECNNAKNLRISVDGKHWIQRYDAKTGCLLEGLTPDTWYTLYYKQGNSSEIYTKPIKTAKEFYGVTIGTNFVTNENTGNLQKDGWHYDAEKKELTIENLELESIGFGAIMEEGLGASITYCGVIAAQDDITITVVGENRLKLLGGFGFDYYIIYGGKNVTLQGNGNLILEDSTYGIFAEENIYLKNTGKQTFNDCDNGYGVEDNVTGIIEYHNGEIDYNGYFYSDTNYGRLFALNNPYSFQNKVHDITIKQGVNDEIASTEENLACTTREDSTGAVHITTTHTYTEEKASREALAAPTGDCTKSVSYYKSCNCGSISTDSKDVFTVPAGEHELESHGAKTSTCDAGGWEAYEICTKCSYHTLKETAPLGHVWSYHEAVQPTCEAPGRPAYDECMNCGISSKLEKTEGTDWAMLEHDLYPVQAIEATCETAGEMSHYACSICENTFENESGTRSISQEKVTIPAFGHKWGDWFVEKAPTETTKGVKKRTCLHDETHVETEEIPAKGGSTQPPASGGQQGGNSQPPVGDGQQGGNSQPPAGQQQEVQNAKDSLENTIKDAGTKQESAYTKESFTAFQQALKEVQSIFNKPNATKEELAQAQSKLQAAIQALKPVGTEKPQVSIQKGTKFKDPKGIYQFKIKNDKEAIFTGVTKSIGTVKIANTVQYAGKTFKVTSVAAKALKGDKVVTNISVGKNVKDIGASAFEGCVKLKKIRLGNNTTKIGNKSLKGCKVLAKVTIPKKVTNLGKSVFEGCSKLSTITIQATALKKVGKNTFKGISTKAKIKVPKKNLAKYKKLLKNKGQSKKVSVR